MRSGNVFQLFIPQYETTNQIKTGSGYVCPTATSCPCFPTFPYGSLGYWTDWRRSRQEPGGARARDKTVLKQQCSSSYWRRVSPRALVQIPAEPYSMLLCLCLAVLHKQLPHVTQQDNIKS
ncbi:hypothetical protein XENTR_v10023787 [Xenopus tropicalis]|nr:hypothetical protein XENTR_v10023787 [Xenopus tropicalis]